MNTRALIYEILLDIEKDKKYSNISLNSYLRKSDLDDKDRGFVTEIVYGVIENKIFLDYCINKYSKVKVKKMNHSVKIALRMGAYQILSCDVADYAAIDESVKIIKKYNYKSKGFVNAILRNISSDKDLLFSYDEDPSIRYSFEGWILKRFENKLGKEESLKLVKSLCEKPKMFVRINRTKMHDVGANDMEGMVSYVEKVLNADGILTTKVDGFNEALEVKGLKNIDKNRLFREGIISIQDISSMLVGYSLAPDNGDRIIDVCSAPGGKSTHIGELMENTGEIVSRDIYDHKLKLIETYRDRLGLKNILVEKGDATKANLNYFEAFDKVVCDAPCSGMGIVRRKPEIKYKSEEEVSSLPKLQLEILNTSSKYVKKGGVLIYSTCTIFDEENKEVVESFLDENKDFVLEEIKLPDSFKNRLFYKNNGMIEILPYRDGMDGFFITRFKRI